MPELPEVEVTRRRIAPLLVGRKIARLRTTADSYFFVTKAAKLRKALCGRSVSTLERHGKYLVAWLDDGARLVIHLGMTGQLFSADARSPRLLSATARSSLSPEEQREDFTPDLHTHLRFEFADGGPGVYMRDVRKFGKVILLAPGEDHPRLDRLGVDALEVTGNLLFEASRKKKAAIKALLLDQSVIAGCGNIYADEALFLAGVRPGRAAGRVTRVECDRIAEALRRVLLRSIESGGSSISDYIAPDGEDGAYQDERRVYARAGEACRECGTEIRKKVVAQRGTHYCPSCQC
jgi:formamidopyrimidine-DNA glycosylase